MSVTIRDIAKKAQVSVGTVSGVINERNHIRPEVRTKVLDTIRELNYDPLKAKRGIQATVRKSIGLVLPTENALAPFYARAVIAGKAEAMSANYNFLLYTDDEVDRITQDDIFPGKRNLHCDGLIFFCPKEGCGRYISVARDWGIPVVVIKGKAVMEGVPVITDDQELGVRLALSHLYSLGHRRIGVSAWFSDGRTVVGPAYRAFMREKGLLVNPAWCNIPGETAPFGGYMDWLRSMFGTAGDKPTAFVCDSDENALCLIQYLMQLGISVPGDVAVVGRNNDQLTRQSAPGITTINVPVPDMVNRAFAMLKDALEKNAFLESGGLVFRPDLVVRGSSDPEIAHQPWRWENAKSNWENKAKRTA